MSWSPGPVSVAGANQLTLKQGEYPRVSTCAEVAKCRQKWRWGWVRGTHGPQPPGAGSVDGGRARGPRTRGPGKGRALTVPEAPPNAVLPPP